MLIWKFVAFIRDVFHDSLDLLRIAKKKCSWSFVIDLWGRDWDGKNRRPEVMWRKKLSRCSCETIALLHKVEAFKICWASEVLGALKKWNYPLMPLLGIIWGHTQQTSRTEVVDVVVNMPRGDVEETQIWLRVFNFTKRRNEIRRWSFKLARLTPTAAHFVSISNFALSPQHNNWIFAELLISTSAVSSFYISASGWWGVVCAELKSLKFKHNKIIRFA